MYILLHTLSCKIKNPIFCSMNPEEAKAIPLPLCCFSFKSQLNCHLYNKI